MLRPVNWRKRVAKYADNHLEPGEKVLATAVFQVRGAVARGAMIGGFGGAARGVAGSTSAYVPCSAIARGAPEGAVYAGGEGLAARLPVKPLLMVLTDFDRLLVYSFVLGTLKLTFATEYRAAQVDAIDVDGGFFARKATIRFTDGSHVVLDLPRMHERKPFLRRFARDM